MREVKVKDLQNIVKRCSYPMNALSDSKSKRLRNRLIVVAKLLFYSQAKNLLRQTLIPISTNDVSAMEGL